MSVSDRSVRPEEAVVVPVVSILTPTYNHEKFIGSCIQSVLRQGFRNWELIIIDDGSNDGTVEVVQGYSDHRIRCIRNPHRGVEGLAHTYNEALGKSKGELIAILEGDDLWPDDKLSTLVPVFGNPAIVLAYGGVRDCSPDGTLSAQPNRDVRRYQGLPDSVLGNLPRGSAGLYMTRADAISLIPESAVVIRRTALEKIGGFQYVPEMCVASYPTFLRLSLLGEFYYTPQIMGFRRRHSASASIRYAAQILSGVQKYAFEFHQQLPRDLVDPQISQIEKTWQLIRYSLQFTAGRVSLVEKRWRDARGHFLKALSPRRPRIFLASLLGWLFAGFHRDLETTLGWFGKARLTTEPLGGSSSTE